MSSRNRLRRFLIDCDPGHDDALAILYACAKLDVVGITTTFGNQTVDRTTRNALSLCTLAGLSVPVAAGAPGPLSGRSVGPSVGPSVDPTVGPSVDAPVDASDLHGVTGIDGAELPSPDRDAIDRGAAEFILDLSRQWPGELVIIATGPLTNVAAALQADTTLASRLAGISVMGGSTGSGNVTPAAEINIYADPEAARVVLGSRVPLWLAGLTVTTTVGATSEVLAGLRATGGRVAGVLAGALDFYLERQQRVYHRNLAPFHDVCAVLPFTDSDLIEYRSAHVDVELDGTLTRGMTVADFRNVPDIGLSHVRPSRPDNALVAVSADGPEIVRRVLAEIVRTYDGQDGSFPPGG